MKTDTIQVCIEALELAREFINAADDWNFDEAEINGEWIRNTRVFARIDTALADLEAVTQAEPHAMPQGGAQWTPLGNGVYGMLQISHDGRDVGIQIDDQWDAEHGDNNYEWLSDANGKGLPDDIRLCRLTPASPAPDHSIRVCNNAECNWIGYNKDTVRLGGVGGGISSLCPNCGETTEELSPSWVREIVDASPAPEGVTQPDWSQAPEWAQWWAVSADGCIGWYAIEPQLLAAFGEWTVPMSAEVRHDARIEIPLGVDWRLFKAQRPPASQPQG